MGTFAALPSLEAGNPRSRGQDALQVLLAFACIHEQTAKRRSAGLSTESS